MNACLAFHKTRIAANHWFVDLYSCSIQHSKYGAIKMISKTLYFLFAIVFLPLSSYSIESCEKALDSIPKYESSKKMFNEILQFKLNFNHCMDGGISEGISAIIVESIEKSWSQTKDISALNKKDPSFQKFILINIQPNVTAQEAEVKSIISKAKKSCPKAMKSFCRELVKFCEKSLLPEYNTI